MISERVTVNKMIIIDTGDRMFEMNIIDQYVSYPLQNKISR